MKLRLTPNSVRFRLNRSEVEKFAESGELVERIDFPGPTLTTLVYCLRFGSHQTTGSAHFENGKFEVKVPQDQAKTWANGLDVGLYYSLEVGGGKSLRISVEKDFDCAHGLSEKRDPDSFPNPAAKPGCKTGHG